MIERFSSLLLIGEIFFIENIFLADKVFRWKYPFSICSCGTSVSNLSKIDINEIIPLMQISKTTSCCLVYINNELYSGDTNRCQTSSEMNIRSSVLLAR